MSWKNVKQHYGIVHIVHVDGAVLKIGSPYINNIIEIDRAGKVIKRYLNGGNDDLSRYQKEIDADPGVFRALFEAPDVFARSIPVFAFVDGQVTEKECEEIGWPNVTHDGSLMYNNQFFLDKPSAIEYARRSLVSDIQWQQEHIDKTMERLQYYQDCLGETKNELLEFEATHGRAPTPGEQESA